MFRKLAVFAVIVFALAFPGQSMAQVDAAGSWKVTFSGGGTLGENTNFNNIMGFSRFTESGWEFGGDILANFFKSPSFCVSYDFYGNCLGEEGGGVSVGGFGFFRGTYNFIGESLTVPFVTAGYGAPLDSNAGSGVYQVGAGIKRFLSERASFDLAVNYQGLAGGQGGGGGAISLLYGMSLYLGGN